MRGPVRQFAVRYAAAFWAYVLEPEERTLQALYELGRDAVAADLSTLDLAAVHHDVLRDALGQIADAAEAEHLARAAGDAFVETLSAYEMVARGFREARAAALSERRQAAVVRRLSSFLADTALAVEGDDSLTEVLHLVAEHARELLRASRCEAALAGAASAVAAEEVAGAGAADGPEQRIQADLRTLEGRRMGSIEVVRRGSLPFSEADRAVLTHLAQMTSGAVERSRLYGRDAAPPVALRRSSS
jgi:hypothetical protein